MYRKIQQYRKRQRFSKTSAPESHDKVQIERPESSSQAQLQKYEAEITSLKASLLTEKENNKKLKEKMKALQEKLLDAENGTKKVDLLLQNVKKGSKALTSLTNKMHKNLIDAEKTVKLVRQLHSRVDVELIKNKRRVRRNRISSESLEMSDDNYDEYDEDDTHEEIHDSYEEEDILESDESKSESICPEEVPKQFQSGNFVILKSQVEWDGDVVISKLHELTLMRIEGKALLQKFVPIVSSNGIILHKCTCVYTGWDVSKRNDYYSVIDILDLKPETKDDKDYCVALKLQELIKVRDR